MRGATKSDNDDDDIRQRRHSGRGKQRRAGRAKRRPSRPANAIGSPTSGYTQQPSPHPGSKKNPGPRDLVVRPQKQRIADQSSDEESPPTKGKGKSKAVVLPDWLREMGGRTPPPMNFDWLHRPDPFSISDLDDEEDPDDEDDAQLRLAISRSLADSGGFIKPSAHISADEQEASDMAIATAYSMLDLNAECNRVGGETERIESHCYFGSR